MALQRVQTELPIPMVDSRTTPLFIHSQSCKLPRLLSRDVRAWQLHLT